MIRAHDDIIDFLYICIMDSWSQTLTVFILLYLYAYAWTLLDTLPSPQFLPSLL
jgi:hypothetical protein